VQEQRDNIVCPSCGNVNPFMAEKCLKCALPLAAIREALSNTKGTEGRSSARQTTEPAKPVPALPELTERPPEEPEWHFVASNRFLVRGIGDRATEIAARLFDQIVERQIKDVKLSHGKLIVEIGQGKTDSRDYYFIERDLGEEAVATMAVHIAAQGKDLFVEWRHYETPPTHMVFGCGPFLLALTLTWGILILIGDTVARRSSSGGVVEGLTFLLIGVIFSIVAGLSLKDKQRRHDLIGFQSQDSSALQLAVRDALSAAIDQAGIAKSLIQPLSDRHEPQQRVI
jgi:hypothetical protein